MADVTHLGRRLAVGEGDPGFGSPPVPAHIRTWHRHWAGEYLRLVREGEPGPALAYLNDLRHGPLAAYADPWRLAEEIAGQAVVVHDASVEPGPGVAVTGPAEVSAPAAAVVREETASGIG